MRERPEGERLTRLGQRWKTLLGTYRWALLVVAVGALLMALPTGSGRSAGEGAAEVSAGTAEVSAGTAEDFDLEGFEQRLAEALSRVDGAGETRVVLTLDGGARSVLARDSQTESDGRGSSTVVTVGRGSGNQSVVPVQTLTPSFRGALVVCPGGGDPLVQLRLSQAVAALTGLGSDRISICQGTN